MNVGDVVAEVALPMTADEGGAAAFSLAALRGRVVVLYFYPKDDTPGCTIESGDFSALLDEFAALGAVVVGISRDGIRSHEKFRAKFAYRHHLLADTEAVLCRRFGVLREAKMYGKPVTKVARSTFVVDREGRLACEWRDIKDVTGHAAEVLERVRALG